ncbi:MAG: FHA domain-containing protein [Alphaproteobacteria bacterium]|nr:MAG: FHA domain-containing protein [Alphaproteobacteria bacterium]
MAVILLLNTNDDPTIEYLFMGKCTIGRSSQCNLPINDSQMSGLHGMFVVDPKGRLFYSDSGSTNGSFLNNSIINMAQIKIYDVLQVGNTTITISAKKLTQSEAMAIGYSTYKKATENKSLDLLPGTQTRPVESLNQNQIDELLDSEVQKLEDEMINEQTRFIDNETDAELIREASINAKTFKNAVVLNKELKKKKPVSDWAGGKKDRIIEQEDLGDDGMTLSLDTGKKKKH